MWPEGRPWRSRCAASPVPDEAAACAALGRLGDRGGASPPGSPRRVDARAGRRGARRPAARPSRGWASSWTPTPAEMAAAAAGLRPHPPAGPRRTDPAEARARQRPAGHRGRRASTARAPWSGPGRARPTWCCWTPRCPGRTAARARTFDWALLDGEALGRPFALAGGLRPENVAEARGPGAPGARRRLERRGVGARDGRTRASCAAFVRGRRGGREPERRARDARRAATRFGAFGGRYVPETVIGALDELSAAYLGATATTPAFRAELRRPARALRRPAHPALPGPRPGGAPTGSTAPLPQARGPVPHGRPQDQQRARPGAPGLDGWASARIIAETGAGQHGVATATAAALMGLECCVYMGRVDMARQRLNVVRMRMLGAEVRPVDSGIGTLKDATQRGHPRLGDQRARTPTTSSARPRARRPTRRSWPSSSR